MKLHEYSGLKVVLCIFSNYEKKKKNLWEYFA
jgi:hypothetical protein